MNIPISDFSSDRNKDTNRPNRVSNPKDYSQAIKNISLSYLFKKDHSLDKNFHPELHVSEACFYY